MKRAEEEKKAAEANISPLKSMANALGGALGGAVQGRLEFGKSIMRNIDAQARFSASPTVAMAGGLGSITSGPMDSLSAGSSEAFKFLNQTTAIKSQEAQMTKERTAAAKETSKNIEKLVGIFEEAQDTIGGFLY